jgi:tetratricopeptide (TPR) repeat protein
VSSTSSRRSSRRRISVVALALVLIGCASRPPQPLASVDELSEVPFFPQTDYDCGPAALATILVAAGVSATPAELMDAVYVEGLRGSLQAELLAATRRYGLLPLRVPAELDGMLAEVAGGRPVLVLQNLGLERAPVWHYAVVVGTDAATNRLVLRSGPERRRLQRARGFVRSWELADQWGFTVVEPGEIPATATADRYMRALVDAERVLSGAKVAAAYAAALARWPAEPLVLFLAGVRAQGEGRLTSAVELYRRTLDRAPDHAAARNNLANALLAQGCRNEALREARAAADRAQADGGFYDEILDTLRQIERTLAPAAEPAACLAG